MKKEWIMSEEARLEKKQRVEENRERRMLDALRAEGDTVRDLQGRYLLAFRRHPRKEDAIRASPRHTTTSPRPPKTTKTTRPRWKR